MQSVEKFFEWLWHYVLGPIYVTLRHGVEEASDRFPGPFYSFVLHCVLFLFLLGAPITCSEKDVQFQAITVELLPVGDVTNVKPKPKQEKKTPKPKPKEERPKPPKVKPQFKPKPKEEPKPTPKEVKPEPEPKPKAEKPKEKEKPKKKEEEKPKEKPKPKEDEFEALLKSIEESDVEEPEEEISSSSDQDFDENLPLSLSEVDAIRSQLSKCWNIPAGARMAEELAVPLRIQLRQNGAVISVEFVEKGRYNNPSNSFYRAAADSARRAVLKCSPLKNLPPDKYDQWKDMEINFDPKEML
jgi:outer membrane biosynthesis protein TonB